MRSDGFNVLGVSLDGALSIVELIFTVREEASGDGEFDATQLMDDLASARVIKGHCGRFG